MQNNFITIEGGDGAGKGTVIKKIEEYFKDKKIKHVITREPGGNRISEEIREIILDKKNTEMDARTEALLYAASRRQHIVETILPALEDNKVVLSDRYIDSSLVYQGIGRKIGVDEVLNMNLFATNGLMPGLTILLKIDPKIGLERIKDNNRENDRLDCEKLAFHQMVAKGYDLIAEKYPERIKVLDATKTPDELGEEAINLIENFINN